MQEGLPTLSFCMPSLAVPAAPRHIPTHPHPAHSHACGTVEEKSPDESLNNYSSRETAHFKAFRPEGCGKSGSDENHNNYSSRETAHFNDFRPKGVRLLQAKSESEPSFPQSCNFSYVPFRTLCKGGCRDCILRMPCSLKQPPDIQSHYSTSTSSRNQFNATI